MFMLGLLVVIFVVTVIFMLIFSPDRMGEPVEFKTEGEYLWGIVKLCQRASFDDPKLELRPARRRVKMDLHFLDADSVSLSLPIILRKQQWERAEYLELLSKHATEVFEFENSLVAHFDRKNEDFGQLISNLYQKIFGANKTDTIKFKVQTLASDKRVLDQLILAKFKFNSPYNFEPPSAKHRGKSVLTVQANRILGAAYFLLFPVITILSYKIADLTGMCWTLIGFFGFFAIYNYMYKELKLLESVFNGSLLYVALLSATLSTQNIVFLQSILSVNGLSVAIMAGASLLGITSPKNEFYIKKKKNKPQEFMLLKSFLILCGLTLFVVNEWMRRKLDIDDWVWFFGMIRIEIMIAMLIVILPAFIVFLKLRHNKDEGQTD